MEAVSELLDSLCLLIVEVDPYFDSEEEVILGAGFGRNKSESIDILVPLEVFPDQIKEQSFINLFMIFLIFVNLKHKPTTFAVLGMLPLGLDVPLENIYGIDLLPLSIDLVSG